jgi:hypothetical protein
VTDTQRLTRAERREGFVPLLADWREQWHTVGDGTWHVDDGVLLCGPRGSGWLRTATEYEDFTLKLEYAVSEGANSGVFVRTSEEGRPAFQGMEFQLLDDHGDPPSKKSTGAIYAALEPECNPARPAGEWNRLRVTLRGTSVSAWLNGEQIHDVDLAEHTEEIPDEEPPTPLADRLKRGYIGLQSHGEPHPTYFRNVRVREHHG